ncbi:MAG: MgtC/SapB family protein [Gorillibacterium sp.]|nr:MgtC/SapB family protein [Gorillibacterium sp.]
MNPFYIDPFDLTIRLVLSLFLGGLIGYERERNSGPAGFRTHILVCVGSTLLMLISAYAFGEFANEPSVRLDPTRLAAQVIPSIGFLGAGTILRNDFSVTGLTTAASLWVAAAIGLAVGAGFYYGAFLATALVLISLYILNKVEKKYITGVRLYNLSLMTVNKAGIIGSISKKLSERRIVINRLAVEEELKEEASVFKIELMIKLPRKLSIIQITEEIKTVEGTLTVSVEPVQV